jgi:hypothetical protein
MYFMCLIRQFIIFLPCLWAGYEKGRRKERIKKMRGQPIRPMSAARNTGLGRICQLELTKRRIIKLFGKELS